MEEAKSIRDIDFYEKVQIAECWKNIWKGPIWTEWIDTSKGGDQAGKYRSRNVAREVAHMKDG